MIYEVSRYVAVELFDHGHKFRRPTARTQLSWTQRAIEVQRELTKAKTGEIPEYQDETLSACLDDLAEYLCEVDGVEVRATSQDLDETLPPDLICMLWSEFYTRSRITAQFLTPSRLPRRRALRSSSTMSTIRCAMRPIRLPWTVHTTTGTVSTWRRSDRFRVS